MRIHQREKQSIRQTLCIDCSVLIVSKKNRIKLFLTGLIAFAIAHNSNPVSANDLPIENSVQSNVELNQTIVQSTSANEMIAKKSGGRSGGGSFKSRPSRSKSSSPSRSSNQRKSTSPSRRSNRREYNSPNYRRPSTPTYYNRSTRSNRGGSGIGNFIFFIFILIFLGGLLFVLFYILKQVFGADPNSSNKAERKIAQERDNDRVTISLLQVALSSEASQIQQDLSELSTTINTSTDTGLVELMRESALILLRNDLNWTHVLAHSNSLDISQAEAEFSRLSLAERSKFTGESLSNVDGNLKTRQSRSDEGDGFPAYIVVTLIFGTADDNPLFSEIYNSPDLKQALLKLSSMRENYLMKFELLWTPQQAGEYLTDEELLMEYTEVMPL